MPHIRPGLQKFFYWPTFFCYLTLTQKYKAWYHSIYCAAAIKGKKGKNISFSTADKESI